MYNAKQVCVSLTAILILATACGPEETPVVVIATPTAVSSHPGNTWFQTYGSEQNSVGWDIMLAEDGGYFVVGTTYLQSGLEQQGDILLIRTDADGRVLWSQTYGSEGHEGGHDLYTTEDGHILITGATRPVGAEETDGYLVEVDQEGNELWSITFGGPLNDSIILARPLEDGGYLLAGNSVDPNDIVAEHGTPGYGGFNGRSSVYLARVDDGGNEIWSQTLGEDINVLTSGAVQTEDGGIVIVETILAYPEMGDDMVLVKFDENGDEVWSRIWEEGAMFAQGLIETSDGGYLITGAYTSPDATDVSNTDFFLVKTDSEGHQVWIEILEDSETIGYGTMLVEAADGGYVVVEESGTAVQWNSGMTLVKFGSDGEQVWRETVQTDTQNLYGAILLHPDGGFVAVGSSQGNIFVVKVDSTGRIQR